MTKRAARLNETLFPGKEYNRSLVVSGYDINGDTIYLAVEGDVTDGRHVKASIRINVTELQTTLSDLKAEALREDALSD